MIRRAIKENCEIVRYSLSEALPWFEPWYRQIMNKVSAPDRFYYNNEYFRRLQNLAEDLVVVSVETGNERLAAAIVIFGAQYNLYHLSVTNPDYSLNYASPFWCMAANKFLRSEIENRWYWAAAELQMKVTAFFGLKSPWERRSLVTILALE